MKENDIVIWYCDDNQADLTGVVKWIDSLNRFVVERCDRPDLWYHPDMIEVKEILNKDVK